MHPKNSHTKCCMYHSTMRKCSLNENQARPILHRCTARERPQLSTRARARSRQVPIHRKLERRCDARVSILVRTPQKVKDDSNGCVHAKGKRAAVGWNPCGTVESPHSVGWHVMKDGASGREDLLGHVQIKWLLDHLTNFELTPLRC